MIDIEMINKIKEWGFDIEKDHTKYKLYHDDASEIIIFSDYLGDEFEEYLKDNYNDNYNYDGSSIWEFFEQNRIEIIEEFFEQYGIEVY